METLNEILRKNPQTSSIDLEFQFNLLNLPLKIVIIFYILDNSPLLMIIYQNSQNLRI